MPYDWEKRIPDSGAEFLGYENNPKLDKQIQKNLHTIQEQIVHAPGNAGAVRIIETSCHW